MGDCCQMGVATLLTCLVLQATVGVAQQGPQSYYWSRNRGDSSHFSQRSSHIGPLPHVNDVMTEWSRWSPWDRCSRSCGGGVRSRSRTCVTRFPRVMPGSGVRTSHDRCAGGDSVEYGVCGVAQCPPAQVSGLSFRAAQCRHYNNKRVFGRLVNNWVPYTQGGINPCALVCEGEGEGIVYTFGKVTDGTHCKTDLSQDGLCVNGRCLRVSCDGRLGGNAREDMCRVCGGKNDTCTHHLGVFHTDLPAADQPPPAASHAQVARPRSFGYYEVTNIPRGSTNVNVRDTSLIPVSLKEGSKFMLNGDWLIDWPGEVEAGGTSFTYSRSEDDSENLFTLGPTTEDLTLMVLLREHNPGIHYEYWTPNSQVSPDTSPPIVVPLPPADTSTTTTPATTTSSSTSTTTTATTITSATAPRPAILTGVNVTRFHKPPLTRTRPPQRSENEIHTPKKPKKPKSKGDGKGQRGRKRKKGQRGKKGKERKGKTEKKQRGRKGKKGGGGKKKLDVPPTCGPCEKPRRQTKHMFCTSDFVSRVEVVGSEAVGGERRLEVVVHQSYKNTVPLLHKEFLWITNPCQCPLLRHGRSYLVMGVTEPTGGREVRLVLTRSSYVRRYKPRNLARILRIRHNEMRFCRPWRRDLRFVQTTSLNSTIPATT
ncbi:ADAMTS-like protein 5 [Homarus americanus]|uniref:ADAMTS-like protein 5 n=1 Tax=Homarus americanus TaxID=6706 RepID=UPI001C457114|nr:ADAMTS-like protein 5 [Homarus americanus]